MPKRPVEGVCGEDLLPFTKDFPFPLCFPLDVEGLGKVEECDELALVVPVCLEMFELVMSNYN